MTGSMPTDYFTLFKADLFSRSMCVNYKVMASSSHHSALDVYCRSLALSTSVAIFMGNYTDLLEHRIVERGNNM